MRTIVFGPHSDLKIDAAGGLLVVSMGPPARIERHPLLGGPTRTVPTAWLRAVVSRGAPLLGHSLDDLGVEIQEVVSGRSVAQLRPEPVDRRVRRLLLLAISPDGQRAFGHGAGDAASADVAYVWDLTSGDLLARRTVSGLLKAHFTLDASGVVWLREHRAVRSVEIWRYTASAQPETAAASSHLDLAADGDEMLWRERALVRWKPATGIRSTRPFPAHDRLEAGGGRVVAVTGRAVLIVDSIDGEVRKLALPARCVAVGPDGMAAVGDFRSSIHLVPALP